MAATKRATKTTLDNVREALTSLKGLRVLKKTTEESEKQVQENTIKALEDFDKQGVGVRFTTYDGEELAGFVQKNEPSVYWDQEKLIEYLKKKGLWNSCSVRVFDQTRFEALVQNGQIPAKEIAGFKVVGKTPTPFIRFGKPKKESI